MSPSSHFKHLKSDAGNDNSFLFERSMYMGTIYLQSCYLTVLCMMVLPAPLLLLSWLGTAAGVRLARVYSSGMVLQVGVDQQGQSLLFPLVCSTRPRCGCTGGWTGPGSASPSACSAGPGSWRPSWRSTGAHCIAQSFSGYYFVIIFS